MGDGAGREAKNQTKAGVIEVMEYHKVIRRGERREGRQSHRNSERMPGMGPGMKASGNCAAYLHSTGRSECGTCEQLKAPTDLEIMEALKAENGELFAKLMAAEGENANMRMEKAADELTILKLKARLYDVLLGDQEENRQ